MAMHSNFAALQRKGAIAHSVEEHQGIVDALRSGKPERAVHAMQRHLDQVHRTTRAVMT
jgi:DNA-binding GntR family transcriptional regulator